MRTVAGAAGLVGGAAVAATGAVAGLIHMLKGTSEGAEKVKDVANATGYLPKSIQQMERAAKMLNIPLGEVEQTAKGIGQAFWDIRDKTDDAFKRQVEFGRHGLGPQYEQLKRLVEGGGSVEQFTEKWREMLETMDPQQRAYAPKLFEIPKSSSKLLVEGSKRLKEAGKGVDVDLEPAREFGKVLSFTFDKLSSLNNLITNESAKALKDYVVEFNKFLDANNKDIAQGVVQFFKDVATALHQLKTVWDQSKDFRDWLGKHVHTGLEPADPNAKPLSHEYLGGDSGSRREALQIR